MPKSYEICLRLSAEEKERLEHSARTCGLSKTAYLRRLILGKEVKALPSQEIKALRTEVHKIGVNINQIARSVNAGIAKAEDARPGAVPVGAGLCAHVRGSEKVVAITKILARKGRLDVGIRYVLNGDKTQEQILTARLNCDPGHECRQMLETKRAVGKEGGVQYYHLIQSFQPGEVTPELALEIAREFAEEHLPGYQTVIGIHVDKEHIHAHILFNSVNADTGEKYHSNAQSYYRQIRVISDRLCRERGLSVLLQGKPTQAVSYIEWLRRSRGQPTFRSMLEEDLRTAIADANDLGHFFLLMEHMGYEISHGNRLGFRLRGQERFMIPGRKNPLFTEDGIRAAIQGNLAAIEAGRRPAVQLRPQYRPYQKYPRYTGFLALYVHYLYLLGKIGKRQYPPRA